MELCDPAVRGDGERQGEGADDDEREAVLGASYRVVSAELDVDPVQTEVAD